MPLSVRMPTGRSAAGLVNRGFVRRSRGLGPAGCGEGRDGRGRRALANLSLAKTPPENLLSAVSKVADPIVGSRCRIANRRPRDVFPSPPFRGEREGPAPKAWEGEVGLS